MVDPPLVAQGDGSLPGAALALPHQEAAVDAAAQQVLGRVPRHRPVVPRVLLQAVHRGDVIAGDPALPVLGLCLAPLPIVVVAQHTELFTLGRGKMYLDMASPGADRDKFFLPYRSPIRIGI